MATLDNVFPRLADRIRGMMAEAPGVFWITEGYRDIAEQWRLYNVMTAAMKKYGAAWRNHAALAAYPGTSMHGRTPARAVDLACEQKNNALRASLARRWGLITPVDGEGWHMEEDPRNLPMPSLTKEQAMTIVVEPIGSATRDQGGGWVFGARGHVYAFDGAPALGNWDEATRSDPSRKCVAMVVANDGAGYFLVSNKGEIYGYGSVKDRLPGNYQAKWGAGQIVGAFRNDLQKLGGVTLVRDDGVNLNLYRLPAA